MEDLSSNPFFSGQQELMDLLKNLTKTKPNQEEEDEGKYTTDLVEAIDIYIGKFHQFSENVYNHF